MYYDQGTTGITVSRLYVDDILITGLSLSRIESTFDSLSSLLIKNLRPVRKFLGMRVRYSKGDGYSFDQEPSICVLLMKVDLD